MVYRFFTAVLYSFSTPVDLIMLDSFVQDLLEKSLCVNSKNVVPNWNLSKVLLYFFDVLEASLLIKVSCDVRMTQQLLFFF